MLIFPVSFDFTSGLGLRSDGPVLRSGMVRRAILRSADKVSKMQALDNEQLRIENLRLREENEELISENRRLNTKLDQMRVFFQEALRNAPDSIN